MDGNRERAPAKGGKDSDVPAQSSGLTHGGALKDAVGVGKGKRDQATASRAQNPDNSPSLLNTILGGDAMDTSGTLTGKRGRAPAEGLMHVDAKCW